MKKLLFTLLIVAGTFMSNAQDDSIKRFRFQSTASASGLDRVHLFSEDLDHCSGNLINASTIEVFTYNTTTRVLSRDGNAQGEPVERRRGAGLGSLFSRTTNQVNVTNTRGGYIRNQTYNEATNTWE